MWGERETLMESDVKKKKCAGAIDFNLGDRLKTRLNKYVACPCPPTAGQPQDHSPPAAAARSPWREKGRGQASHQIHQLVEVLLGKHLGRNQQHSLPPCEKLAKRVRQKREATDGRAKEGEGEERNTQARQGLAERKALTRGGGGQHGEHGYDGLATADVTLKQPGWRWKWERGSKSRPIEDAAAHHLYIGSKPAMSARISATACDCPWVRENGSADWAAASASGEIMTDELLRSAGE